MNVKELIDWWRKIEAQNAPLRVEGEITPRHKLVYQARLRLSILDPEVKVWMREYTGQETGLIVCRYKRYRLAEDVLRFVV